MQQSSFEFAHSASLPAENLPTVKHPSNTSPVNVEGRVNTVSELHLAAARKLSREFRRAGCCSPQSPVARRTVHLVCRHLLASL